jgi:hypothetical protein
MFIVTNTEYKKKIERLEHLINILTNVMKEERTRRFPISQYEISRFYESDRNDKKYYALIFNRADPSEIHKIYFGAKKLIGDEWIPYDQYKDTTPLQLYSDYNHYDEVRLMKYLSRHQPFDLDYITPDTLSLLYLWHP